MAQEFKFPDIGEGIEEGEVVKWHIRSGDEIKEHQVVGEIETEKAVAEIPSPYSGIVLKINFKPGETVKVGEVLFVVGKKGEKVLEEGSRQVEPAGAGKKEPKYSAAGAVGFLEEAPEGEETSTEVSKPTKAAEPAVLATPQVRKLAQELGIDLSKVSPTGEGGRITEQDVRGPAQPQKSKMVVKKKYDMWGYVDREPLKGIRKSIAQHMSEAHKRIPQVTMMDEAEITTLVNLREKEKIKAKKKGIKLTYLPYITKACMIGFKEFPLLNATLDEKNEEIIVKKYYNFGFAVDINGKGLLVPVVKGIDMKDIYTIAKEIHELADKARNRTIDLQDMRGGTFTITNFGSVGSKFSTPIINYPEAAILGIGRMYGDPPLLPLSLSFDHRVVDGAYATRFLNLLIQTLQNPKELLKK
ncbi:2-oxo acid dehydrogenase subunit E2 [Patescibacteria group bacterium AH-259-L05]|nr:2-oxo acid dehydrogenase subunit E2 [Patescibacteria group bacterium AH-259-L05]